MCVCDAPAVPNIGVPELAFQEKPKGVQQKEDSLFCGDKRITRMFFEAFDCNPKPVDSFHEVPT